MMETKEKDIGGMRFAVQQLPGMRAARLWHKLLAAVAPALGKAVGTGNAASLMEMELGNLGEAAQILFDRLPANEFESVIRELLETATVTQGNATMPLMPVFDQTMAGKIKTLLGLLKFALEVNYGDFFGDLGAQARLLMASRSTSPSVSKGLGLATG